MIISPAIKRTDLVISVHMECFRVFETLITNGTPTKREKSGCIRINNKEMKEMSFLWNYHKKTYKCMV